MKLLCLCQSSLNLVDRLKNYEQAEGRRIEGREIDIQDDHLNFISLRNLTGKVKAKQTKSHELAEDISETEL